MRPRTTLTAVFASLALMTPLSGSPSSAATSPPPVAVTSGQAPEAALGQASTVADTQRIRWHRCQDFVLQIFEAECGRVSVPLDYSKPGGRQISLAVSRVRHDPDVEYQGVMLVNPGGPGGSGRIFSILSGFMPAGSGAGYDWIGFDPRGVGASKPRLSCIPSFLHGDRPPYTPLNKTILRKNLHRAQAYADACKRDRPELIKHLRTRDSARDMHRIGAALGAKRINYYGYSYGTYLGQVYATMFPNGVRRMVLDSNVDPRKVWYQANLNQDKAFEAVVQRWFDWIARYRSTYHLGRTGYAVEKKFYREKAQLTRRPANGVLGPAEWTDAFTTVAYSQGSWPRSARIFANFVHKGKAGAAIRAWRNYATPGDDNLFAVYNAVECSDAPWPRKWSVWKRDNERIAQFAPFFTWANAWFNAACRVWPVKAGKPVRVDGHGVRALLLGETLDAATPFRGSLEVRNRFDKSSLVAIQGGTTHAANPFASSRCTLNIIASYLKRGALPDRRTGRRADATCKPLPEPQPVGPRSPTAKAASEASALLERWLHWGP